MAQSGSAPSGTAPAKGFTLVEVLTAIAVLSVVLLLATEAYQRTMALFQRGGEHLRQTRAVLAALEDLGADLAAGVPGPETLAAERGTPAGEVVLKLHSAAAGRHRDLSEGPERFEIVYRLQAAEPRRPARRRLIREVRKEGAQAPVESRAYDLEVAGLEVRSLVPEAGPTPGPRAMEVRLRYFLGRDLDTTESMSRLVEALASGPGERLR